MYQFHHVVVAVFEIGGVFWQKLIGVFRCQNDAIKALREFDYEEEFSKRVDDKIVTTTTFDSFGREDNADTYSRTAYVRGDSDYGGTVIITVYSTEGE